MDVNAKCSNCEFWFFRPEKTVMGDCLKIAQEELGADEGCIGQITNEDGATFAITDGVLTGENFGCIHFKKIKAATDKEIQEVTNKQ